MLRLYIKLHDGGRPAPQEAEQKVPSGAGPPKVLNSQAYMAGQRAPLAVMYAWLLHNTVGIAHPAVSR
ncbi:hypothetical protein SAMN00790413_00828 [Deinococcus hopiensis KR-140]|uniref:Uncharacterized protein n=1 Tax=Deinococcus hopiensis KR-140 TaxID=695939 RepID=A0A1W1VCB0_9DEIO|nr:hypothetical protein SAMN00790413_00828 [Deinococcus hopiensis KR-140]